MSGVAMALGSLFGLITYVTSGDVTDALLWFIWGNTLAGLFLLADMRSEQRRRTPQ